MAVPIKGRMSQKHDIEANWLKATNFIPMQGEIIVYDVDSNYTYERLKIGDGIKTVNNLPFVDAMPETTEPNMQLVTDANGNKVWEEKKDQLWGTW